MTGTFYNTSTGNYTLSANFPKLVKMYDTSTTTQILTNTFRNINIKKL